MSGPTVETSYGTLEGKEKRGALSFRGIPFAKPPVGDLRFRPPQPPDAWTGVRDATTYGPAAPQSMGAMNQLLGGQQGGETSEDCLTLNVFTPAADDGRRPVMVWIHGGAFLIGTGATPWYDGANLASKRDVVLVSINYRLGALGFLHLGDLGGDDFAGSGNLGILDQAAALRWVRDNIAAFGGDPENVTIFGESAGGMSTTTLLALPEARGLFHRAIPQSGAASFVHAPDAAEAVSREVMAEVGLGPSDVARLREVPAEALADAQSAVMMRHWSEPGLSMPFQPVVDGVSLPEHPLTGVRAGTAGNAPLMTGTTLEEMNLFITLDPRLMEMTEHDLVARAERYFGGQLDPAKVVGAYRGRLGADAPLTDVLCAILTDAAFRVPAIRLAEAQGAHEPSTHMYLFTYRTPEFAGRLGACHALELVFMFDNLDAPGAAFLAGQPTPEMRELSTAMADAWCEFARTGTPKAAGLPDWPAYEPGSRSTMVLGTDGGCEVVDDPYGDERALWDDVPLGGLV